MWAVSNDSVQKIRGISLKECISRAPTTSELGGHCYLTSNTRNDESRAAENTPLVCITRKWSFNACHREGNKKSNRSRIMPRCHVPLKPQNRDFLLLLRKAFVFFSPGPWLVMSLHKPRDCARFIARVQGLE